MANRIILKRSSVSAKTPTAADLSAGELAINLADKRLYSKDVGGTIIPITVDASHVNSGTLDVTRIPAAVFNNFGQTHSTRTSFDASVPSYDFGFRFVQGATNGPGTGGGQFYSWYIGLGSDYPSTGAGSYGAMFAVDRNVTTPYLSVRYNEANSFSSWRKVAAGYADTVGSITSSQVTTALGYTPENSANKGAANGYASLDSTGKVPSAQLPAMGGAGTVTSVSGTGTVSGLTLSGTVTSSGSLTLGGTLSLTSGNVTTALGYTPYNSTNPSGYITGSGSITGSAYQGFVQDTRSSVTGPSTGAKQVRWDFVGNSTDGLSDGGTYHGVMTFQQWSDASGGGTRQLGFTDNDNLWIRGSGTALTAYNSWKLLLNSSNYNSYAPTLTGTGASGTWGISITGSAASITGTYGGTLTSSQVTTALGYTPYNATGYTVITASNYLSYSPSLTGSGASGTWAINISGNAATATTATSANSVAWGNISSRPSWLTTTNLIGDLSNFNSSSPSGFYQGNAATNAPTGGTWYNLINVRHSNTGNDHGFQLAMSYYANTLYHRTYQNGTGNSDGTFTAWATVLSSVNYNSYSPTLTGTGASGTWGISITGSSASCTGNAATASTTDNINGRAFYNRDSGNGLGQDSYTNNGVGYVTGVSLFGQTDGGLYASAYSSSWIHQIYGDFRTGQIAVRGKNSGTWQSWRTVLDSSNYTSYSPSLTGSGASGTWGINVTGSSASCTGNAATVTNGVYTTGDQTIGGNKTFTGVAYFTNGWIEFGLSSLVDRVVFKNYSSGNTVGNILFASSRWQFIAGNGASSGIVFSTNATSYALAIANDGSITTANTISDSLGNVRAIPQNAQTAAYTLVATDAGKHISITTGGVTVPSGVFAIGNAVTIYNNSGSNQTITQGASVTMYLGGTANTGNRTLAQRGVATLLCVASNTFVISGAGLT